MKELKMSWKTEEGRLVCHWIESAAAEHEVALKRINPLTPSDDLAAFGPSSHKGQLALFRAA